MFSDIHGVTYDEYCIPLFTMKDNGSNMVWMAEHGTRFEVLKTGFRSRKRMFSVFSNTQRSAALDLKPH